MSADRSMTKDVFHRVSARPVHALFAQTANGRPSPTGPQSSRRARVVSVFKRNLRNCSNHSDHLEKVYSLISEKVSVMTQWDIDKDLEASLADIDLCELWIKLVREKEPTAAKEVLRAETWSKIISERVARGVGRTVGALAGEYALPESRGASPRRCPGRALVKRFW